MYSFSSDRDILKYEPSLFGDLSVHSQRRVSGSDGQLSSTTLTDTNADFITSAIEAEMAIHMTGDNESGLFGVFEIVSVDSSTQLTVSVLRTETDQSPIAPPASNSVHYHICTYQVQSREVLIELTQGLGLSPGISDANYGADDILNPDSLRQCSTYGVLAMVFVTLA